MADIVVTFGESNTNTIIWTMTVSDIELVAGMLAAGTSIIETLNQPENGTRLNDLVAKSTQVDNKKLFDLISTGFSHSLNFHRSPPDYYIDSTADVSAFRLAKEIDEADLSLHMIGQLQPNHYGLWMNSAVPFKYNLYTFTGPTFYQGMITICHHFGVDFRNIYYGELFDAYGNQYALEDYLMTNSQVAMDVPDVDDVADYYDTDAERSKDGDENLIQPLEIGGFPENNDL